MRAAAIDCGTNTVRLLLVEQDDTGALQVLTRQLITTRLGQGVDQSGEFHAEALARTFAATKTYAQEIAAAKIPQDNIRFVATSAARDAKNKTEFFAGITEILGVAPEIISGDLEAQYSFNGAVSGLRPLVKTDNQNLPVLVMDIGGGSTELILGTLAGAVVQCVSLNMGSVRIKERFWQSDPPKAADVAAAQEFIDQLLTSSKMDFDLPVLFIGVGGTATSISALSQDLPEYDGVKVHGAAVSPDELCVLAQQLRTLKAVEILAKYPMLSPGRADVISAGALIAESVVNRVGINMIASETDILDGVISAILANELE